MWILVTSISNLWWFCQPIISPLSQFLSDNFLMFKSSFIFLVTEKNRLFVACNCNSIWDSGLLIHWGRVTHICVSTLTITGSDNGLSPGRRQAIIWTNAGLLLIRSLGTYFSEILGKIHLFSFKKMHLKISSAKGRLFSLGLNELMWQCYFLSIA